MELYQERMKRVRICLEPKELDKDYKTHLYQKIYKKWNHTCTNEVGMLMKIQEDFCIIAHEIMTMTPNVFFLIDIRLITYLPKPNHIINAKIEKTFSYGIFASYLENIRIIVPIEYHPDLKFMKDFTNQYIYDTKNKIMIKQKDFIRISLKEVRFEKDGFSCIGLYKPDIEKT